MHCFSFPSISDFPQVFILSIYTVSMAVLSMFFFPPLHFVFLDSLVLWWKRNIDCIFPTSPLIFSDFHIHSLSRAQWSPANTYSSANTRIFFCCISFPDDSQIQWNTVLLLAHWGLWHNLQTSYKELLLVAFWKTQIVQVAPCAMGFWLWQTWMACCIEV